MVHTYYTATKKDAHEKPFITWGNAWLSKSKVGLQEKIVLKERAWWCVTFKKPCIYALSRRFTSHVGVLELREVLQSDDGTEPSFIPSFPGLVMTEAFSKETPSPATGLRRVSLPHCLAPCWPPCLQQVDGSSHPPGGTQEPP